ncbi:DUF2795 domain-containing protein [Halorubellus sp. JP-L1]|uniref:DUF5789 family protein n=1 Tax=Halorubellus sp. JP-L1 TaxID=2715753 RepID=UPI00140C3EB8|nr:DUF2795 domain-containing protein [Halorubellus sp. JP-L1]NHN43504.1 DUF2795 domain-containing protein [Halorubellus sp. JP-L1]
MRLNSTGDRIEDQTYPLTTDDLTDAIGDGEIELADGTESIDDVLERFGDQTFHTPEDVRHTLQAGVCERAIGRKGYSDRDPTTPGSVYGHDCVSF